MADDVKEKNASEGGITICCVNETYESIYDIYSKGKRRLILLTISIASILVPFCDTIYLPALQVPVSNIMEQCKAMRTNCHAYLLSCRPSKVTSIRVKHLLQPLLPSTCLWLASAPCSAGQPPIVLDASQCTCPSLWPSWQTALYAYLHQTLVCS